MLEVFMFMQFADGTLAIDTQVPKSATVVETVVSDPYQYAQIHEPANTFILDTLQGKAMPTRGTPRNGPRVAVIDTGIAPHPDLEDRVVPLYRYPGAATGDQHGHGTHVAGLIGAADNGQWISGVSPDATLYDAKVVNTNGRAAAIHIAEAIVAAVNADVEVINISLQGDAPMPIVDTAIALAIDRGISVVAAAGNQGKHGSPAQYPGANSQVIAVGALDQHGEVAEFSNTNSYVDVYIRGQAVESLSKDGWVEWRSGTSQAAPIVAGVVANVKHRVPTTPQQMLELVRTHHANQGAIFAALGWASPATSPMMHYRRVSRL